MTPQENKDDLIRRMRDQFHQDNRRELTSEEKLHIENQVVHEILPQVYDETPQKKAE